MRLAISNIGWAKESDNYIYDLMKKYGFTGLEIAPTRIFPDNPYDKLEEAKKWAGMLKMENDFDVPSMQSIWYGRTEKLFGTVEERTSLLEYSKKAIEFAEAIGCKNLVFGCPRNRFMPDGSDETIAIRFFKEIGDYAASHGTVVGMEANPPIYNTNYINDTRSALELIKRVDSEGLKLNLDVGTMVENKEDISVLQDEEQFINHVHISEPGLKVIEKRTLHNELAELLTECGYNGFVSIEVGKQDNISLIEYMMRYVEEVFG